MASLCILRFSLLISRHTCYIFSNKCQGWSGTGCGGTILCLLIKMEPKHGGPKPARTRSNLVATGSKSKKCPSKAKAALYLPDHCYGRAEGPYTWCLGWPNISIIWLRVYYPTTDPCPMLVTRFCKVMLPLVQISHTGGPGIRHDAFWRVLQGMHCTADNRTANCTPHFSFAEN